MATKKLKVELELETAKAKRQAKDLEQTAGGSAGSSAQGGKNLATSLDKAARSAEKSVEAIDRMRDSAERLAKDIDGISGGVSAKAKRQAKDLEQTAGSGWTSSVSSGSARRTDATDRMADALDKASKSAGKSAESFDKVNSHALQLTKGFVGIAVGMAASYAANYATGGTKTALQYGGGILSGASAGATMGAAAGPQAAAIGAVAGGVAGGVKTFMDRDAAHSAVAKEYREGEERYAAAKDWETKFREITGIGQNKQSDFITDDDKRLKAEMDDTAKHLEDTKTNIKMLNGAIGGLKASLETMIRSGDTDSEEFKKLTTDLQDHRAKLQSLENAEKALERETHQQKVAAAKKAEEDKKKNNDRGGFSAADSLGKLGIAFAGEGFAVPASGDSPQAPSSKPKALSSGFGFGFSVPVTPSVTHEFSAAAEGLADPVDKLVDERLKQINEDQLKVLQDIAANTKERGLTWQ